MNEFQVDEERIYQVLEPHRKKQNRYKGILLGYVCCMFLYPVVMGYLMPILVNLNRVATNVIAFIIAIIGGLLNILALPAIIILAVLWTKANREYKKKYKQLIAENVLCSMFDDARFYPDRGYTEAEFKGMHLIYWRNDFSYYSEDLITGSYKGVEFGRADIRITHTSGSGKSRKTIVDVDGRLMEFAWRKEINSRILIVKKGERARLESGLNEIEMEDVEFNQKFDVYAEDAHSVFYLLTPRFMEYIKTLYDRDKMIYISFDRRRLYFLQSGHGGIFEPPEKGFNVHIETEKTRDELAEIGQIIELLQLDDMAEREKLLNVEI